MGEVSASREYPCNNLNPVKLLKIVQKRLRSVREIQITGDVTYEDGISENRKFFGTYN
jgi:hypothetical protein